MIDEIDEEKYDLKKNTNFYQINLPPIGGLQTWLNKKIDKSS